MKIPPKIISVLLGVALLLGAGLMAQLPKQALAGGLFYSTRGYPQPYYYPGVYGRGQTVIIEQRTPIIIERRGSNDYLYEYDNVYGPEASAAGRMTRTVVNPQPQIQVIRGF